MNERSFLYIVATGARSLPNLGGDVVLDEAGGGAEAAARRRALRRRDLHTDGSGRAVGCGARRSAAPELARLVGADVLLLAALLARRAREGVLAR